MKITKLFHGIAILILFVSCKAPLYETKWQDHEVVADGNPKEWKIPLRFYDNKSKLSYTVTNDLDNLYICIRITDDASQIKVMRAGMQIWLDTTGSNKQTTGILFPKRISQQPDPVPQNSETNSKRTSGGHQVNMKHLRTDFQREYKEMQVTGFKAPIRGALPLQNDFGINIGINWDANRYDSSFIMIYEAVIPFKTFYKNKLTLTDSVKKFGVSIIVSQLPYAPGKSGGARGGGGSGMAGGGMRGGGMGGGWRTRWRGWTARCAGSFKSPL
jgi:hypothetical protein